ncbi:PAS domain S-box protein [Aquiflexum sp. TKW24L]|uniref:response regulator n=1 Tax=Aquiflexum sp. TKW24L TaxID=2942212 RepID=UPI0020C082CA|nr:response regulator [Aquiflexum sp. TKW24L]MCL6259900.1 PAS domain S-box protein [Aquiflexum sp. TKW24L]
MIKDKKKHQILLVEDNYGDFVLVEEYLEEMIAEPVIIRMENYREAKEILTEKKTKFDVILLDLTLPDKSGLQLVGEMISIAENTPIIVLTGYADANFAIKSLSMGISDYLLKDDLSPTILFKSIIYNIERNKNFVRLQESEQRYVDLFQLSPQPMWVFDVNTLDFLNVNQAAIVHYGYSEEEFMHMTVRDIRPKEELEYLDNLMDSVRKENPKYLRVIVNHLKKDGTLIRVEIHSNAIVFQGRRCRLILANDITAKLKYLEAIEAQNEKLRDIAWMQSHILRAPLSRMMGIIDLIQRENLNELESKEFMGHLINSAKELDVIIKDVVEKAQQITIQDQIRPK